MPQQTLDTGLGTTYERFALYAWLDQVIGKYPVTSVLEGPGDGMTGIPGLNSLPFARHDVDVTVVLDSEWAIDLARRAWDSQDQLDQVEFHCSSDHQLPIREQTFDLVWNFNRLPFLDAAQLLPEMVRLSNRYILLFVPNQYNYAFPIRQIHHKLTGKPWVYGDTNVMKYQPVIDLLQAHNLRVLETVMVDVPWWPDIIDVTELVGDLVPFMARFMPDRKGSTAYRWEPEALPYFDRQNFADLHQQMDKLFFIERLRQDWIRRPFAHHLGILAEKPEPAQSNVDRQAKE